MDVSTAKTILQNKREKEFRDREIENILKIILAAEKLSDNCVRVYVSGNKEVKVGIHDEKDRPRIPKHIEDYTVQVEVAYKPALVGW